MPPGTTRRQRLECARAFFVGASYLYFRTQEF